MYGGSYKCKYIYKELMMYSNFRESGFTDFRNKLQANEFPFSKTEYTLSGVLGFGVMKFPELLNLKIATDTVM